MAVPDSVIVTRLRAAGCVFAEDEARLLIAAARTPAELDVMVGQRVAGLPLEQVGAMATTNSANMAGMDDIVGTLEVGRDADVSVLDDERGRWVLKDNEGTQVVADRMLTPSYCLSRGIRYEADASILPTALAA